MLEELAGDLAFGIVTLRSRAARERAEQELTLLGFALDNVREAALLCDDQGLFRISAGYAQQRAQDRSQGETIFREQPSAYRESRAEGVSRSCSTSSVFA